jgi:hypothetical protein
MRAMPTSKNGRATERREAQSGIGSLQTTTVRTKRRLIKLWRWRENQCGEVVAMIISPALLLLIKAV